MCIAFANISVCEVNIAFVDALAVQGRQIASEVAPRTESARQNAPKSFLLTAALKRSASDAPAWPDLPAAHEAEEADREPRANLSAKAWSFTSRGSGLRGQRSSLSIAPMVSTPGPAVPRPYLRYIGEACKVHTIKSAEPFITALLMMTTSRTCGLTGQPDQPGQLGWARADRPARPARPARPGQAKTGS